MWLARFSHYILTHRWRAFLLTVLITFIPFGIGTPIAIWIATFVLLQKGILDGALLTLAATLVFVLVAVSAFFEGNGIPLGLWIGLGFAVISNVITFAFGIALKRGASWSAILQISALAGVLIVSVLHLVFPNIANWWGVQLQAFSVQMPSMLSVFNSNNPEQLQMIEMAKQCATGVMVAAILMQGLFQLVIGQWWQSILYSPQSLGKQLHAIRLSQLAGFLFVVSLVLSYFGNPVVLDIMPVLCVLFLAGGLSLVHYFFGLLASNTKFAWLALFYMILIFTVPMSVMLVSILALLDTWADLRKRFKKV